MTGRLLVLSAAPILMVYAAFGAEVGLPGGSSAFQQANRVQGDPVSCPDGRTLTSVFELDGSSFHVLGALISMEGRAAVVSGPTGDVPMVLSDTASVSAGLVIGEPAEATGSIDEFGAYVADTLVAICTESPPAPTTGPAPIAAAGADFGEGASADGQCNRGPGHAGDLRLDVKHGKVDLKRGTVLAATPGSMTVDTLGGSVAVMITDETKVKGDLSLAAEVRIKGDLDNGVIVADKAWALCPDAAHHESSDDQGDDEQGDDEQEGNDEDHDEGGGEDD